MAFPWVSCVLLSIFSSSCFYGPNISPTRVAILSVTWDGRGGRVVNTVLRVMEDLDLKTGYPEECRGLHQPLQANTGIGP